MVNKGALNNEQLRAIHAKANERPDFARMQIMQNQLRANEGSVPEFEHKRLGYTFGLIKKAAGQRDQVLEAQKLQREKTEQARKKMLLELEARIGKERELRQQLADKKITFDEFNEKVSKINPNVKPINRGALPSMESGKLEGETDEAYAERSKLIKSKESQEKYYQDVKAPMKIFPNGSQFATQKYNAETGKYYFSHALTPEEQRKYGVEIPTKEGILNGSGEVIQIPVSKPEESITSEKPTFKSEKEKRQVQQERETSSDNSNPGTILLSALEQA